VAFYCVPSTEGALISRNSAETLSVTIYSAETATDEDSQSVTLGIVSEAGTTIVAAGTAATRTATGVYGYSLAGQADLSRLTVTWSGTFGGNAMSFITQTEIVGGHYSTPAEVRSLDSLSGEASAYPTADLVSAITWATEVIDNYCGTSFVYRYHRDVLDGTDTDNIKLSQLFPQKILAGSIAGTALTAQQISDLNRYTDGVIRLKDDTWTFTNPGGQVIVDYEAGVSKTAPPDIAWAARTLSRFYALELKNRIPSNAMSITNEFGNVSLAQSGMNKPTPLPDVNTVLNRHRHRAPVIF
jgi:hypothetical protein